MIALTAFLPLLLSLAGVRAWSSDNHTCALSAPVYSCENTTAIVDTCCVPTEGLVLVTQVSGPLHAEKGRTALTSSSGAL
jgi:hypothetical protein